MVSNGCHMIGKQVQFCGWITWPEGLGHQEVGYQEEKRDKVVFGAIDHSSPNRTGKRPCQVLDH